MATANNFVTSNIFNIHDEVVGNGLSYCVLCLRSEKERKLVPPKSLAIFLNSLSNAQNFRDLKVCYVCEAHAVSAVKFITAVKFALSVDQLLNDIKINKHKNLRRDLKLRLNGLSRIEYPALTLAMECEAQYKTARSRAHLSTTEVLLVSSQGVENVSTQTAAKRTHSKEISKDIETVVLDDEDEVVNITPKPMPLIQTSPVSQIQVHSGMKVMLPSQTNQLILHPLVPSIDGKFYAPSLQKTIAASETEFAYITPEQLEAIKNAHSDVRKVVMPEIEAIIENNCSNPSPKYTVNVIDIEDSILPDAASTKVHPNANNANNKAETIAKNHFQSNVDNFIQDKTNEVQKNNKRLNTKEADVNFKKKCNETGESTMYTTMDFDEKETIHVPVKVSNGTIILNDDSALVKNPIPDPKRIDWEDKIPMDVISFMDATDPNPRGNMGLENSNMGVISEVRSLGPEKSNLINKPSAVPTSPNKKRTVTSESVSVNIPCIDLC